MKRHTMGKAGLSVLLAIVMVINPVIVSPPIALAQQPPILPQYGVQVNVPGPLG
jgi:hypothetical protein